MSDEQQQQSEQSSEIEKEARKMGWKPQSEFMGKPDVWVDAEEYVRRGHEVLPIVQQHNKRLEDEARATSERIAQLERTIAANQEAMDAMKESAKEGAKMAAQRARAEALEELRQAREEGDLDAELAAQDKLRDAQQKEQQAERKEELKPAPIKLDPVLITWIDQHPWYGKDEAKTARANAIGVLINTDPETANLRGQEFLDELSRRLDPTATEKVAGGGAGGLGGSSRGATGKGYASLPPDAKEACERQGKKLVGPGRAYKNTAEWQQAYAEMYFQE